MVAQHADDAVAQVNGEAGKHAPHLRVQWHKGFQNESVRSFLFRFGGIRHGLFVVLLGLRKQ